MVSPMLQLLGGGCHVVKDFSKQIYPEKVTIMQPDEYPELIKNPSNTFSIKHCREDWIFGRYHRRRENQPNHGHTGEMQKVGNTIKALKKPVPST
jgi:hypothetical protein